MLRDMVRFGARATLRASLIAGAVLAALACDEDGRDSTSAEEAGPEAGADDLGDGDGDDTDPGDGDGDDTDPGDGDGEPGDGDPGCTPGSSGCTCAADESCELGNFCVEGYCEPFADAEHFEANTSVTFTAPGLDPIPRDLEGCYFCDASLSAGTAIVRFQQGEDGGSVLMLTFDDATQPGPWTLDGDDKFVVTLAVMHEDLPPEVRGNYTTVAGELVFDVLELEAGGLVEGHVDVHLESGDADAYLLSEFSAKFPG